MYTMDIKTLLQARQGLDRSSQRVQDYTLTDFSSQQSETEKNGSQHHATYKVEHLLV